MAAPDHPILDETMRNNTPVVVLNCKIGALAIMRSLGKLGVAVHGVDSDADCAAFRSRFCAGREIKPFVGTDPEEYLDFVLGIGKKMGRMSILIPTSDELSVFTAVHAERLSPYFVFPRNDPAVVRGLISKKEMYALALKHDVPTPRTLFPESMDDVIRYSEEAIFPVMVKGIHGNRLFQRTGVKMVIARTQQDLLDHYRILEDPEFPNLMLQEYIPGGDDSIHIFNGYFDRNSDCLAGFTGHKIRQYPIHVGCASLGICLSNPTVSEMTIRFMKNLGYRGILDIGYRWDERDGLYKVLDVNPRVGQAFRLFLSRSGMDVVRALYLDLTGQGIREHLVPREGRKWMIEDYDMESSLEYVREGSLTLRGWASSFKGLEECAWFDPIDLSPFFAMCRNLGRKIFRWVVKRFQSERHPSSAPPQDLRHSSDLHERKVPGNR